MLKHILAAAVAAALITAPLTPAFAQATTEKSEKKAKTSAKAAEPKSEKKLSAQQQKMKDCAEVGCLQEGKEREGPRGIPQVHEHLSEGLNGSPQTHRGRRRDLKSLRRPLPSISVGRSQVNYASTRDTHRNRMT